MTLQPFPTFIQLRNWQIRAEQTYHELDAKNFLAYVTPGAGKTIFSLKIAHNLLSEARIRDVFVVVHTDHLRNQWLASAKRLGVPIKVLTYQEIAKNPEYISTYVMPWRGSLVIFDEIHHAADNQQWGDALGTAFKKAYRRLLLTGTPFRHDEKRIRYVRYERGIGQADFSYGYAEALKDGIVRPVFFPLIGGEMKWKIGDDEFVRVFGDKLNRTDANRRLRTAINPRGSFMTSLIQHAHLKLCELRQTHAKAGGLIVASDQKHAEALARLVQRITETKAEVAISNYRDASNRISAFADSDTPWLVAVRMISEGVDIPRLRVGVYATNVTTELFFRQWVGRYVRSQSELEEQSAYLYLPNDPLLADYARTFSEERQHVLRVSEFEGHSGNLVSRVYSEPMEIISAVATIGDVIAGGEAFTQEELAEAERMKHSLGLGYLPNEPVAKIMRAMRERETEREFA